MSRNTTILLLSVLLIVSLAIVGFSFMSPDQKIVSQPVKTLEYTQKGAFNYTVTATPSFFYDNVSTTAPESSPQIPVKYIEDFDIIFTCQTPDSKGTVEINAFMENPGAWKKTLNLVPQKAKPGNIFSTTFAIDLKSLQELADTIDKEIGLTSSSRDLTLQAIVSSDSGPEFIQTLPIKMTKSFIKISDNRVLRRGDIKGKFDYQVKLVENTLFGPVILTPSPVLSDSMVRTLGSTDTVFLNFIDSMRVGYNYNFTTDKKLNQTDVEVTIEAVVENPGKWTKSYTMVPPTKQQGDFAVEFPLDIKSFSSIFSTIQQETGVQASTQDLTLKATVHVLAKTDTESIDKTFTQSIKTDLRQGILAWTGDMKKSEPGAIEKQESIAEPATLLGLPLQWIRIGSAGVLLIAIALMLLYLIPGSRMRQLSTQKTDAKAANRKYKAMMVEVSELPEAKPGLTVLPVSSIEDLVKVSQGLLKPMHHKADKDRDVYWVYDDSTLYEYSMLNAASDAEKEKESEKPKT
jgi:hypothetical protein